MGKDEKKLNRPITEPVCLDPLPGQRSGNGFNRGQSNDSDIQRGYCRNRHGSDHRAERQEQEGLIIAGAIPDDSPLFVVDKTILF